MTTSLLLRVASIISLLFAAGHTLGGRNAWSPAGENNVLQAMRTVRFDVFSAVLALCLVIAFFMAR